MELRVKYLPVGREEVGQDCKGGDTSIPNDVILEGADESVVEAFNNLHLQCLVRFVPVAELAHVDLVIPVGFSDMRQGHILRDRGSCSWVGQNGAVHPLIDIGVVLVGSGNESIVTKPDVTKI